MNSWRSRRQVALFRLAARGRITKFALPLQLFPRAQSFTVGVVGIVSEIIPARQLLERVEGQLANADRLLFGPERRDESLKDLGVRRLVRGIADQHFRDERGGIIAKFLRELIAHAVGGVGTEPHVGANRSQRALARDRDRRCARAWASRATGPRAI